MLDIINKKELGFMEILSIAMHLFIKNIKPIAIVVCVLFLPISIVTTMLVERVHSGSVILLNMMQSGMTDENLLAYENEYIRLLINTTLSFAVTIFLEPIGVIAIAKIGKSYLCGKAMNVKDAIGEGMNCLFGVILTGILFSVCVIFGTFLFIIPGLYLSIVWGFYIYVVGLNGVKGWNAVKYSTQLTKNRFWKTLAFFWGLAFIVFGWSWTIGVLFSLGYDHSIVSILSTMISYFFACFAYFAITVLFMNREAILLGVQQGLNEEAMLRSDAESKE
ncbi:MAG: hypothetical protein ACK5I7_00850 [Anaerotignum sp.]